MRASARAVKGQIHTDNWRFSTGTLLEKVKRGSLSIKRCVYKDLIALLEDGCLMTENEKRSKMESCYRGDRVVACTKAHNGTNFCQVREWRGIPDNPDWEGRFLIRFIFTTRVYRNWL